MDKNLIKKLLIIGGGLLGVLILFIMIVSITRSISNKKNPYGKIKSSAVVGAQKYYDLLKEKLNSGESIEISFDELVSKKHMKEYSSKLDDGVKCSGKVVITNNFDDILYTAIMDCGKNYKDETLYDHILNNNEIVTSDDGIYDLYGKYIYRGENVNNYVEFDGKTWYIVDMDKGGKIKLLSAKKTYDYEIPWDNRYNINTKYNSGYNAYSKSNISEVLNQLEKNADYFSEKSKKYVAPQDICIGKRSEKETDITGSIDCSQVVNNKMFGAMTVSDVMNVSIDQYCSINSQMACTNYNYLMSRGLRDFWLLNANTDDDYSVYYYSNTIKLIKAYEYKYLYVTIKLTPEAQYLSGDGTESNPYKIVEN